MTAPRVLHCFTHDGQERTCGLVQWQPRIFDKKIRFLGLLILHHLFTSRCKCLLILATKLPILGIILYRKGINPRSLIGTIGTHLQRGGVRMYILLWPCTI